MGGMGEVYMARDTRLDRSVAIKVLKPEIATDPDLRARFEREARAVAALDHPHICALHDIGHENGVDFLVMEYLEGQTLAERVQKGALPVDQVLKIAIEIAGALDKAHRAGIVHRDLTPANIMLTKAGSKLLDFGLAKLKVSAPPSSMSGVTRLATPLTASGTILGTVPYMAPEQVEGKEADARSDIWAFGAVMYEMTTGNRPFDGESPASVIGAILKDDPPSISTRQPLASRSLDRIVSVCLAKDPYDRWQTARDLWRELQWIGEAGTATGRDERPRTAAPGALPALVAALAAVAALAVTIAAVTVWRTPRAAPVPDVRFSIYPEPGSAFSTPPASVVVPQFAVSFALSPDGTNLAFVATHNAGPMLWVRPLSAPTARVLAGTNDATYPFWSGDGRSIGFFAQGKLKTVGLGGSAPIVRADASLDSRGGAWALDGTMLVSLAPNVGLSQVSADGSMRPVLPLDRAAGDISHRWPSFLPDGRRFLFSGWNRDARKHGVYLAALGDDTKRRLVDSDWGAAAVDGRLLFLRGRTLMAQALDLENWRVTGEPVRLLDDVGATPDGYPAFAVSRSGIVAYAEPWPTRGEPVWFSRDGRRVGDPIAPLADYVDFALSPDSRRLAISRVDSQTITSDIWVLDLERGSMARLTSDPSQDAGPLWSPDGSRIVFRSNRRGLDGLFDKPSNGSRDEELLFEGDELGNFVFSDGLRT
jgi:predicted Ser/Thr protein kinase